MDGNLRGRLTQLGRLSGTIAAGANLQGRVQAISGAVTYTGEYIVVPKVYEQTLETAHKVMADDVTVLEIPYHEVSNPFNGITVTIGG